MANYESTQRLIAKVIRDLIATERFEAFADFRDQLRRRLIAMKIRYTQAEFDAAITLVASNTALTQPKQPDPAEDTPEPPIIPREEAPQLLKRLMTEVRARTGTVPAKPIHVMPRARLVTAGEADHAKAAQMVVNEIRAADARCAALEASLEADRE